MYEDLLRAIIANPEDDTVRLVCADWFEEHGQPERAEFIRAQIELARLPNEDVRRAELEDKQAVLFTAHGERWLSELPEGTRKERSLHNTETMFRRGLVAEVLVSAERFLECGPELFESAPLECLQLEELTLRAIQGRQQQQARMRASLARIREQLPQEPDPVPPRTTSPFPEVLASPLLLGLRKLDLRFNELGSADAAILAASPQLANLRELDLSSNKIGDAGTAALAASPHLGRLTSLDLWFNGMGASGIRALVESPLLGRLEELGLGGCQFGAIGVHALLRGNRLGSLRKLTLGGNRLPAPTVRLLASASSLENLEELDLHCNPIGPEGIIALAGSPQSL